MSYLNKIFVYPTILYGVLLEKTGFRTWYTRVDDHCVLGAIPMKHNYQEIVIKENIKGVLTMNEDHELEFSVSREEWSKLGVEVMQIPIKDYTGVASLEQLKKGVDFINTHRSQNQSVYVHCKAGRYRSALMVACYLINTKQYTPEEARNFLKEKRPQVILNIDRQKKAMQSFYEYVKNK